MRCRFRSGLLVAAILFAVFTEDCTGEAASPSRGKTFGPGIILIGCKRTDGSDTSWIKTIAPDGISVGDDIPMGDEAVISSRLSPDGTFIGYSSESGLHLIDSRGRVRMITDNPGFITAWSPDSKQLAFYRNAQADEKGAWESFVIDVAMGRESKLSLAEDYLAEDWHPDGSCRSLVHLNVRNRMHLENREDWYPLRQLSALRADGKIALLTTDPDSDNIWSRYSPAGDRMVHYRRRFIDNRPFEFAVVCNRDGSHAKEVFGFTDFARKEGLKSCRPHGFPAWAPDGGAVAWLAHSKHDPDAPIGRVELIRISTDEGKPRRIPIADMGLTWVSAVDWR